MNRYEIAIDKKAPPEEPVQSLDLEAVKKVKERFNFFRPEYDKSIRVGICYGDPSSLFVSSYVHFKKKYFLCKSTEGHTEICCEYSKRFYRACCALAVYRLPSLEYDLQPWLFTQGSQRRLAEAHKNFPLDKYDFFIKKTNKTFNDFELMAASNSLWQQQQLPRSASVLLGNRKNFIGQDLSVDQIRALVHDEIEMRNIDPLYSESI